MFYSIRLNKLKLFVVIFVVILLFIGKWAINTYYPLKYESIIIEKAEKYELEPSFVCSIIRTESRFNKNAISKKGAKGLMQLMKTTAEWGFSEIGIENYASYDILDEEINIELGCWYIKKLINQYDGDKYLAIAAYNAGSGNISKWLKDPKYSKDGKTLYYVPFKETRDYIEKVKKNEKIYSVLLKL